MAQPLFLEFLVVAGCIAMIGVVVSLRNIFTNVAALNDINSMSSFFVSAFIHTSTVVKIIITGASVAGLIFIGDSVRRIRRAIVYRT